MQRAGTGESLILPASFMPDHNVFSDALLKDWLSICFLHDFGLFEENKRSVEQYSKRVQEDECD